MLDSIILSTMIITVTSPRTYVGDGSACLKQIDSATPHCFATFSLEEPHLEDLTAPSLTCSRAEEMRILHMGSGIRRKFN